MRMCDQNRSLLPLERSLELRCSRFSPPCSRLVFCTRYHYDAYRRWRKKGDIWPTGKMKRQLKPSTTRYNAGTHEPPRSCDRRHIPAVDPSSLISTILKHDAKQTSYKIALLRAINDAVLAFHDLRYQTRDIAIPLVTLADFGHAVTLRELAYLPERRNVGFKASRSASPRRFSENTKIIMAVPG